jgi:hypothetical protein
LSAPIAAAESRRNAMQPEISMRPTLLFALAIGCTCAAAQEIFVIPPAPTQWETVKIVIRDTVNASCPGRFVLEGAGNRTFKAYYVPDTTSNIPNCAPSATQVTSSGLLPPSPAGTSRIDYYRPGESVPTSSKTFTVEATTITRDNPIEIIPAAPTSADVIRVRFRVYDSLCENMNGFTEGVELPSGNVILRFNFPVISTLCPSPPPPFEYSIAPKPAGTFQVGVVDLDTGSTEHARKTITVTESAGDALPNVRDAAVNTSDLWQPRGQDGWGVTINQHGPAPTRLFATMFWFGPSPPILQTDGAPRWYVVTGGTWVRKNVYSGTIYLQRGSAANVDYSLASASVAPAGTALLEFLSPTSMKLHVNWKADSLVYPSYTLYPSNGGVPDLNTYPIYGLQSSFMATFDRLAF